MQHENEEVMAVPMLVSSDDSAGFKKPMPNPSEDDLEGKLFNAIWSELKDWDINVPEYYNGYCSGNGSHVMLILNRIREAFPQGKMQ